MTISKEPIIESKFLDSDLWFHGYSDIQSPNRQNSLISTSEVSIRDTFNRAGLEAYKLSVAPIERLPQAVDFVLSDSETDILVEIDGPTHFLKARHSNGVKALPYDGKTLFRSSLMHKQSPDSTILRIDYKICNSLLECRKEAQFHFCQKLFHAAASQNPGVYRTSLEGDAVQPLFSNERAFA